ncbi:MAG: DMT family transporter [Eggerthellaceae bacterium]|jgi:drug/metabolite transporter (DMT)-like permease
MTVRQAQALLAAVIAARATSFLFSKMLVDSLQPFDLLAVRFLLATALLAVVFRKRLAALSARALLHGGIIGCAFFATMACEMHALQGASSSTVSFLENMAVVFVPLATALAARRLPTPPMALACGTALAGVGFLTLGGSAGVDTPAGILFGLGSGAGYTVAILATARLAREDDPIQLGIVQIAVMGVLALAATLLFETPRLPAGAGQWGSLAVLVIVCTGFGFTLQPMAQRHLSADTAGLFCALSPLVATLMGCVFLGEPLTPVRVTGMALIGGSMLVASIPRGKRKTPAGLGRAGV